MNRTDEYIMNLINKQKFGNIPMEIFAKDNYVPIVKKDTANFLRIVATMVQPKKILEIGTAIGYSTKILLDACEQSKVISLEIDYERYKLAQKNLRKYASRVELKLCDAEDYLLNCEEKFDLIFLDGAKGQYLSYLPSILRLLNNGGVFVADNVLQEGMTSGEVPTKHKLESTIHKMNKFLESLFKDKNLVTTILPIGDGVSISINIRKEEE